MTHRESRRQTLYMYLFISPWLIGFLVFALYPILSSLYYSFTDYDIIHPPKFVGLANYTEMLHNDLFWKSVVVTVRYTFISVLGPTASGARFCAAAEPENTVSRFFPHRHVFSQHGLRRRDVAAVVLDFQSIDRPVQLRAVLVRHQRPGMAHEPGLRAVRADDHVVLDGGLRHDFVPRGTAGRARKPGGSRQA